MKKILLLVLSLLSISLFGFINGESQSQLAKVDQLKGEQQQTDEIAEGIVTQLVKDFGNNLQKVSLLAQKELVKKSMEEHYRDFVSSTILAKWINDPLNAPGRLTSSPWPDRIEILSVKKLAEDAYEVKGEIIEISSTEQLKDDIAAKRPITLLVKNINNRWLITDVTLGANVETN